MLRNLKFLSWVAFPLALFAFSSRAYALQPRVDDAGGFLDADTISKADAIISQIKRDTGRDLMVETYPSIPDPLKPQFQQVGKDQFYLKWSYDRARELGVNGVYILITREPRHIQVLVGSVTLAKYFPEDARAQLTELLIQAFKNNDYNGGLLQGAVFVQKTMTANAMARQNADPPAATGTGGVGGWVCLGVAILVGLVLLVNFFGRRGSGYSSAGYPPGSPQSGFPPGYSGGYGPGGGGGGFGRGLLGGLLGGAVGGWAYDRFMRGGGGGEGYSTGPGATGGAPSDVDTTYTGAGGDFGNSGDTGTSAGGDFGDTSSGDTSSGSDFGDGGASAGGDFGGGDSGGGGGDSGGSGGGDF